MKTFLVRFDEEHGYIHEIVREKAYRDSRTMGKDVSRHSLMLELLRAGIESKKSDPAWRDVIKEFEH
jgi:hypothetical protein